MMKTLKNLLKRMIMMINITRVMKKMNKNTKIIFQRLILEMSSYKNNQIKCKFQKNRQMNSKIISFKNNRKRNFQTKNISKDIEN